MAFTTEKRFARTVCKRCPQCTRLSDRLLADGRGGLCSVCLVHLQSVRTTWRTERIVRGLCVDCGAPREQERQNKTTCQGCADCKAQKRRTRNDLQCWSVRETLQT